MKKFIISITLPQGPREYFQGAGNNYKAGGTRNFVNYIISSNKELLTLVEHFENYPLLT